MALCDVGRIDLAKAAMARAVAVCPGQRTVKLFSEFHDSSRIRDRTSRKREGEWA